MQSAAKTTMRIRNSLRLRRLPATHTVWNRRSVYSGENPYYIYGT